MLLYVEYFLYVGSFGIYSVLMQINGLNLIINLKIQNSHSHENDKHEYLMAVNDRLYDYMIYFKNK